MVLRAVVNRSDGLGHGSGDQGFFSYNQLRLKNTHASVSVRQLRYFMLFFLENQAVYI